MDNKIFVRGGVLFLVVIIVVMISGCAYPPPNQYQSSTSFVANSSGVTYKKSVNAITQNTGPILGGWRPLLPLPCYSGGYGYYNRPYYGGWRGRGYW